MAPDPRTAYVSAYDAARLALTALLVQQGLRPTSSGGHVAVSEAAIAQFGSGFREFDALRRRRRWNQVEYPQMPVESTVAESEAEKAITRARDIVAAAQQLIDQLGFFD